MNDQKDINEQKLRALYQQSKQQIPNNEILTKKILQATDKKAAKNPVHKQWLAIAAAILVSVLTIDMINWSKNLTEDTHNSYSSSLVQLTPVDVSQGDHIIIVKEIQQIEAFIKSTTSESLTLSEGFNQHLLAYQNKYMRQPNSIVYAVAAQIRVSGKQLVIHFCDSDERVQKFYANNLDVQKQQQFLNQLQTAQMVTVYLSLDGNVSAISPNQRQQCS